MRPQIVFQLSYLILATPGMLNSWVFLKNSANLVQLFGHWPATANINIYINMSEELYYKDKHN